MSAIDIDSVGEGGSSTRLAAHRAAMKLAGGGRLDAADVKHILAAQAERRAARLRGQETDQPTAITPRAPTASKPARQASGPTAEQLAQARRCARHDAVMNSPQAEGRQATAASLLGGAPHLSAAQIVAVLPTLPTDAQALENARRARAAAAWDRAIASNWPNHTN